MDVPAILLVAALVGGLASSGQAINYDEIVAKGYRWVTVDGPYACVSKDDLRQILKKRGTEAELQAIKQQRAYYLLQGDIVKVTREDPTSGMSLIRIAGVPKDLWTATKLLSKRPIENAFGVVETPETSGLILAEITRLKDL
jgi:DNA-directed RNA polymerase subunit H (RpoH/RPB5)